MNIAVLQKTLHQSLAGNLTFPQVVKQLLAEGVESYHVDLVSGENRYYNANDEIYVESMPFKHPSAAEVFSPMDVAAAIKCVQAGQINYPLFLRKILAAGTVYYIAYLTGRKVIYFGRQGNMHIEPFPAVN